METMCVKVRLKPGSLGRVRAWAKELRTRSEEVLMTLRDEGVLVESAFLGSDKQGDYLIYYMKARSLEEAGERARDSTHPIDGFHQRFKAETWESRTPLELLIDFENFE